MTAKRKPVTYPARKPLDAEVLGPPQPAAPEVEADPGTPAKAPPGPPSRQGKRAVTFYLDADQWLALRTTSLRTGRPTHELMAEAAAWIIAKHA